MYSDNAMISCNCCSGYSIDFGEYVQAKCISKKGCFYVHFHPEQTCQFKKDEYAFSYIKLSYKYNLRIHCSTVAVLWSCKNGEDDIRSSRRMKNKKCVKRNPIISNTYYDALLMMICYQL